MRTNPNPWGGSSRLCRGAALVHAILGTMDARMGRLYVPGKQYHDYTNRIRLTRPP